MYYVDPKTCIRLAGVKTLDEIKIHHLMEIAEKEKPFAYRYYNGDSYRSSKDQADDVVCGKFGELYTMIELAKSGHEITQGVLFTEQNDPQMYGDGGIDLIVDGTKKVQVKFVRGAWFNFNTERQEDAVRKNLEDSVSILVCIRKYDNKDMNKDVYEIRRLSKDVFNTQLKKSKNGGWSYISPYNLDKFNGEL